MLTDKSRSSHRTGSPLVGTDPNWPSEVPAQAYVKERMGTARFKSRSTSTAIWYLVATARLSIGSMTHNQLQPRQKPEPEIAVGEKRK